MLFDFMAALAVTGGFAVLIGLLRPDFYRWAPKFGPVLLVPKASAFDVSQRLATASPAAKWVVMIAIAIGGLQVLSWWTVPVLFALFMVVAHFAPETLDRLLGPNHVFHYKEWWKNRIPAWSLPVASVAANVVTVFVLPYFWAYLLTLSVGITMIGFPFAAAKDVKKAVTERDRWMLVGGVITMVVSTACIIAWLPPLSYVALAALIVVGAVLIGKEQGWAWAKKLPLIN